MKKIILLSILSLSIFLIIGCKNQQTNQDSPPKPDSGFSPIFVPPPLPLPSSPTLETQQEPTKQEEVRIPPVIKDTNSLKTYQDKQYGFEFQFPKDWKIEPTGLADLGNKVNLIFDSGFSLSVWNDAYSVDEMKTLNGGIETNVKEKKIIFADNQATEVSYTAVADADLGSSQVKKIVFSRNKLIYVIDCSTKVNEKINPTFGGINTCEKVLPTFKFTK